VPPPGLTPAAGRPILPLVSTADVPLVRLQLRYPNENIFIQRFAPNVTRGGIFLASRAPFPVGTVIAFEVLLTQGPPLLAGTGKVAWVREFNPQEPQRAHGMGVQFLVVAPACRPTLERLLAHKAIPPRFTPASGVPVPQVEQPSGPTSAPGSGPHRAAGLDGDPSTWIDDQGVRLAAIRARVLASRVDDIEALRTREREEPPTLEEALTELPRLLGPRRQAS
jgi:uncharacterized protein (TIGR02266 family)